MSDDYTTYRIDIADDHPDWPGGWAKIGGCSAADAIGLVMSPAATQVKEFGEHLIEWSFDQPATVEGVGRTDSRLTASLVAAWTQKLLEPVPLRAAPTAMGGGTNTEYPDLNMAMTPN